MLEPCLLAAAFMQLSTPVTNIHRGVDNRSSVECILRVAAVCDSARDSLNVNSCTHSNKGSAVMDGDPAVETQLDGFSLVLPLPYRVALIIVLGMPYVST